MRKCRNVFAFPAVLRIMKRRFGLSAAVLPAGNRENTLLRRFGFASPFALLAEKLRLSQIKPGKIRRTPQTDAGENSKSYKTALFCPILRFLIIFRCLSAKRRKKVKQPDFDGNGAIFTIFCVKILRFGAIFRSASGEIGAF